MENFLSSINGVSFGVGAGSSEEGLSVWWQTIGGIRMGKLAVSQNIDPEMVFQCLSEDDRYIPHDGTRVQLIQEGDLIPRDIQPPPVTTEVSEDEINGNWLLTDSQINNLTIPQVKKLLDDKKIKYEATNRKTTLLTLWRRSFPENQNPQLYRRELFPNFPYESPPKPSRAQLGLPPIANADLFHTLEEGDEASESSARLFNQWIRTQYGYNDVLQYYLVKDQHKDRVVSTYYLNGLSNTEDLKDKWMKKINLYGDMNFVDVQPDSRNPDAFSQIIGYHDVKTDLQNQIEIQLNKRMPIGVKAPYVFCLYSPPGLGKTRFASSIAQFLWNTLNKNDTTRGTRVRKSFYTPTGGAFIGDTEKEIRNMFEIFAGQFEFLGRDREFGEIYGAPYPPWREDRYSVWFIDEAEQLLKNKQGFGGKETDSESVKFTNGFQKALGTPLANVFGIDDTIEEDIQYQENMIIVLATNYPWMFEPAIMSRISSNIFIPYPQPDEIYQLLMLFFKQKFEDERIGTLIWKNWSKYTKNIEFPWLKLPLEQPVIVNLFMMLSGRDIENRITALQLTLMNYQRKHLLFIETNITESNEEQMEFGSRMRNLVDRRQMRVQQRSANPRRKYIPINDNFELNDKEKSDYAQLGLTKKREPMMASEGTLYSYDQIREKNGYVLQYDVLKYMFERNEQLAFSVFYYWFGTLVTNTDMKVIVMTFIYLYYPNQLTELLAANDTTQKNIEEFKKLEIGKMIKSQIFYVTVYDLLVQDTSLNQWNYYNLIYCILSSKNNKWFSYKPRSATPRNDFIKTLGEMDSYIAEQLNLQFSNRTGFDAYQKILFLYLEKNWGQKQSNLLESLRKAFPPDLEEKEEEQSRRKVVPKRKGEEEVNLPEKIKKFQKFKPDQEKFSARFNTFTKKQQQQLENPKLRTILESFGYYQ